MRQAITKTAIIGGILEQEYVLIHENNHCQIYNGNLHIFDGYILEGYKVFDNLIKEAEANAKKLDLSFEIK